MKRDVPVAPEKFFPAATEREVMEALGMENFMDWKYNFTPLANRLYTLFGKLKRGWVPARWNAVAGKDTPAPIASISDLSSTFRVACSHCGHVLYTNQRTWQWRHMETCKKHPDYVAPVKVKTDEELEREAEAEALALIRSMNWRSA